MDYKKAKQELVNKTHILKVIGNNRDRKWDIQTKINFQKRMFEIW